VAINVVDFERLLTSRERFGSEGEGAAEAAEEVRR